MSQKLAVTERSRRMYSSAGSYGGMGDFSMVTEDILNLIKEEAAPETGRERMDTGIDLLTGLNHKQAAREWIDRYLEGQIAAEECMLLVADIDSLKSVNERVGIKAGNALLLNIAESLTEAFAQDYLARLGGDKFMIFMKAPGRDHGILMKLRVVEHIFQNACLLTDLDTDVTCSIGLSCYPSDGENFMQLLYCADAALRKTKDMGGNHYRFFHKNMLAGPGVSQKEMKAVYESYQVLPEEAEPITRFDSELIGFSLEVLNGSKNINSAIGLILDRMGRYFEVSNVSILEKTGDGKYFRLTYFWDHITKSSLLSTYRGIGYADFCGYQEYFAKDGLFSISDFNSLAGRNEGIRQFISVTHILSMIQCAFYEDGELKGCISLHDTCRNHAWTDSEKVEFATVTKIVSAYLLKMRNSDIVRLRMEAIRDFDALTGLPTKERFRENTEAYLRAHPDHRYAVVYSDISNFKYINDMLGYEAGDRVLAEFASLIRRNYESGELTGRVTSDNFLGLLRYESTEALVEKVMEINSRFNTEQKANNLNRNLAVVSGISLIDPFRPDIIQAIDNANLARKSIKGSAKTACQFFSEEMELQVKKEREIITTMEQALQEKEFTVYMQPKYALTDDTIVGAEALVRWIRPGQTVLSPQEFIPLFEKNGFVVNVDFYVYEEVCKTMQRWIQTGKPVVPVSVNVSRLHLNDERFLEHFIKLVNQYQIPPRLLEMELTESVFLDNTEAAMEVMKKLREFGFGVAIDDFGAGYSSLNLLKDMDTDVLKLDKEFFGSGSLKKEEQIILTSIITMAKQLNMKVLSEGVETQEQSAFLKDVACDMVQGYLYAKPMPIPEFEELLYKAAGRYKIFKES